MQFLTEFLPLVLFFAAYKLFDLYVATAVAIVFTMGTLAWTRYQKQPISLQQWATLGIITIFGGMTLLLKDDWFIKVKPTILYWIMASVFLGSQWTQRSIIERLLSQHVTLNQAQWMKLNLSWVLFFVGLGALNLYILKQYSTDTWVTYKVFGTLGLTLSFTISQGIYLMKVQSSKNG